MAMCLTNWLIGVALISNALKSETFSTTSSSPPLFMSSKTTAATLMMDVVDQRSLLQEDLTVTSLKPETLKTTSTATTTILSELKDKINVSINKSSTAKNRFDRRNELITTHSPSITMPELVDDNLRSKVDLEEMPDECNVFSWMAFVAGFVAAFLVLGIVIGTQKACIFYQEKNYHFL